MSFLSGYRAYIIGGLTVILIVLHLFGVNIPGVDYTALGGIGAALSALFARAGATNQAAKALVAANSTTAATVAEAKSVIAATK